MNVNETTGDTFESIVRDLVNDASSRSEAYRYVCRGFESFDDEAFAIAQAIIDEKFNQRTTNDIWIASWVSVNEWEAHRWDGGYEAVNDMAEPDGIVLLGSKADVDKAKAMALKEISAEWHEENEPETSEVPSFTWHSRIMADTREAWRLMNGDEHVATLVARKAILVD